MNEEELLFLRPLHLFLRYIQHFEAPINIDHFLFNWGEAFHCPENKIIEKEDVGEKQGKHHFVFGVSRYDTEKGAKSQNGDRYEIHAKREPGLNWVGPTISLDVIV